MIDLVFPYVNSSDVIWQQTYKKYCEDNNVPPNLLGTEAERFRDWGDLLRFKFRAIAKNLPWINNIYFIVQSESQVPEWLDKSKVRIITHKDFIPERYLPTYNSTTIEMFLWNIPGLSEQFIYSNDDIFAINSCSEDDFYSCSGLPKVHLYLKDKVSINAFRKTLINGQEMINKDFPSIKIPEDKYYRTDHLMVPLLKSTVEQVWKKHRIEICNNISAFRTNKNVNQYIYTYYQVFSNQFLDVKFPGAYLDFESTKISTICDIINDKSYKAICINDSGLNNEKDAIDVFNAFQRVFNQKCKYELVQADDIQSRTFDIIGALKKHNFIESKTSIIQLYDDSNLWSVKYIPEHKYPWLLIVRPLQYNECFTDTIAIKDAVSKLLLSIQPIDEAITNLEENPIFKGSKEFSLKYDNYDIVKVPDQDAFILKNEKQYTFENIKISKNILLLINEKLSTINF